MKNTSWLTALWLVTFTALTVVHDRPAIAQEESEEHLIEKALNDCLEKDSSTHGMIGCFDKATKAWDEELNRIYGKLKPLLSEAEQAQLKDAEKKWLAYRDAELKVLGAVYDKMDGTMYQPMRVNSAMNLTQDRAMQLKSYLDLLENQGEPEGEEESGGSEE